MELCSMICWFNPFFYMMKKELMTIHEYLADRHAISAGDPLEYAELLLVRSLDRKTAGLTSPMFYQTIKRRITMITTKGAMRSGRMGRWMAIPAALLLFVVFGFRVERGGSGGSAGYSGEPITLVVDAGHGGIDPGAEVAGIEDEKIWTLRLAKRVSDLAADYHVKVVLTRSTDILPGNAVDKMKGLENRVEIAKQAGAMAFVSLHVNNDEMGVPTKATGFEAYVSKRRMDAKSIELAGSLLQRLSPLYATLRDVKRREEEGIYVLDHNVFPAVLLECGYMNNPNDIQFLGKEANQDAFARAILQGVVDFFAKK
jgi:N-acetylmuramoyl-L-alanine amidase